MANLRQLNTASEASATQTDSATKTTETAKATATTTDAASATDLNTAGKTTSDTASETGTDTKSNSKTSSGSKSTTSVNEDDPAGSAVLQTPVTTLTSALYKIGDYATFAWNYTNLQVTPTAVDLVVSASSSTWILTSNMTFETDASYLWDTAAYQTQAMNNQQPLMVEKYTLYILEAESKVTATAGPGSLTANAALTFGLYTGQPYTGLSEGWVCGTCSGALSDSDKRALGFLFTMVGITVMSFTWFVTGLW